MNNDKKYIVYMHTSPNDKKYIGITCSKNPNVRWMNGNGYKYNNYFYNAIEKYGWDSFKHEILYSGLSQEEAWDKEKELISKYETTNPQNGYNHHHGGKIAYDENCNIIKIKRQEQKRFIESDYCEDYDYIKYLGRLFISDFIKGKHVFDIIIVRYDNDPYDKFCDVYENINQCIYIQNQFLDTKLISKDFEDIYKNSIHIDGIKYDLLKNTHHWIEFKQYVLKDIEEQLLDIKNTKYDELFKFKKHRKKYIEAIQQEDIALKRMLLSKKELLMNDIL